MSLLETQGPTKIYGGITANSNVDFTLEEGDTMALIGPNGAGKTTVMRAIMGHVPLGAGRITMDGAEISALPPEEVPRRGIGYVPQGRRLFPDLTVSENIEMGLLHSAGRGQGGTKATRDWVLEIFPRLGERLGQRAKTLSGGEQQMLTTARALCLRPKLLLLDEPTEGLQPSMIALIRDVITRMRAEGLAVVLVEQRVDAVLSIADRVTFIETGRSVETGAPAALRETPEKLHHYLGV